MNKQDAKPRTIVALWKANLEELNLNQADPAVVISDISSSNIFLPYSMYICFVTFYIIISIYIIIHMVQAYI